MWKNTNLLAFDFKLDILLITNVYIGLINAMAP